jgi:hypothetical protein
MSEEHAFEFDTNILPAEKRNESSFFKSNTPAARKNGTKEATTPSPAPETGIVAALQARRNTEAHVETPSNGPQLLLLGAALYRYDVWTLPALLESVNADPDPPPQVTNVLPFVRQLVE